MKARYKITENAAGEFVVSERWALFLWETHGAHSSKEKAENHLEWCLSIDRKVRDRKKRKNTTYYDKDGAPL